MPVPVETLRSMKKVNVIFALTAVVTLATMLWMMWHDHDRKWRHMQIDYFNLQSALAHLTVLAFDGEAEQEKLRGLEEAVQREEAALEDKQDRLAELRDDLERLGGEKLAAALAFGDLNSEIQVTAFIVEEHLTLHGKDDPRTAAARALYDEQFAELARRKTVQDEVLDGLAKAKSELKALDAKRVAAQKALDQYLKKRADAERNYKMYGPGLTRSVFNMVGIDYLTPKGTIGRQEVRQVYMPDVRFNYNYLDSYQTDRCITCHVGIDNPDMTKENFVRQAEKVLHADVVSAVAARRKNEYIIELRRRLAPIEADRTNDEIAALSDKVARRPFVRSFVLESNVYFKEIGRPALRVDDLMSAIEAANPLTRAAVEQAITNAAMAVFEGQKPRSPDSGKPLEYGEMDSAQRDRYVGSLLGVVNDYLEEQGDPRVKLDPVLLAHPNLDLYVNADSKHPMGLMGCTVCHEGSGQETDFILAAHTPSSSKQQHEWEHNYGEKAAGILPLNSFHVVEEYWDHPMFPRDYLSASCTKCHDQVMDLERYRTQQAMMAVPSKNPGSREAALRIVEGRALFTEVGCINCHNVDGLSDSRRVGPDLAHVGEKLTTGFMERWIEYPKNFRPSTQMPHFFRQENNLLPEPNNPVFDPDPLLRTETEIQAMTHYLRTFSRGYDPLPLPEGVSGDAGRGESLFTSIGCLACHVKLDARDPTDEAGRTFGERWIVRHEVMRNDKSEEAAKAEYEAKSKNERVQYALRAFTRAERDRSKAASVEEELRADLAGDDPDEGKMYIPPVFARTGPELSGLGTKLIPDAADEAQRQRATHWMYNWIRDPRHYSETAKMPRLFEDNYYWKDAEAERDGRRDQDVMDLAAFLLSGRNDDFDQTPIADDEAHRTEARRLILMLLGGQNTESVAEKILGDVKLGAPNSYGRLSASIVRQTYKSFGGGDAGRAAAHARFAGQSLEEKQRLYLGMKMISHYGCYACHNVTGFEEASRPGTDQSGWGQKYISQLDFAFFSPPFHEEIKAKPDVFGKLYPEKPEFAHLVRDLGQNPENDILHSHASFAFHKMLNPRIYDREKIKKPYDKLKMPNFFFTDDEAHSLVTFLLSRRDPWVTERLQIPYETTPAGKIAKGRALVRELNCIGCHAIESNWANIHQYYKDDSSLSDNDPIGKRFMPPLLWGQGAKVQSGWMHRFLGNVEMLRPWHNARMPTFYLATEDRTTLVEYFVGLAQDESGMLEEQIRPVLKHIVAAHAAIGTNGTNGADSGEIDDSIGADWFVDDNLTDPAAFLKQWALSHGQMSPYSFQVEPGASVQERVDALTQGYGDSLGRAGFMSSLFDIEYPFPRRMSSPIDEARYELGKDLFLNQKCLACHVAGDPTAEGTTADIKAPNFGLTYERLRYDWVIAWLQDPQAIQPGANMPQIFQGGSAFSSVPAEQRAEMEGKFGTTVDGQAGLLVDFLYALGNRRDTVVQPGAANAGAEAPASQPTSQPADEDFDF